MGVLGVYLKHTFSSPSFCITGLFGPFSITFCMGPERFKVKAEHLFYKENEFTPKMVRHAFPGLRDLGQVTAAASARPSWSYEMWLSGLSISFRTTPNLFLTSCLLSIFRAQCIFFCCCFIITLDLQLVLILKVTMKTLQNTREGSHGPQVCTGCLRKIRQTRRVMGTLTSL